MRKMPSEHGVAVSVVQRVAGEMKSTLARA
jgi:hypothetical protein